MQSPLSRSSTRHLQLVAALTTRTRARTSSSSRDSKDYIWLASFTLYRNVWERPKTPSSTPLLRLGGIRLRCPRPQQLVKDFYVKRLGMQELTLSSSPPGRPGGTGDALEFKLVLPPRQQLHQLVQQGSSIRSQNNRRSSPSSRGDLSTALNEGIGRHRTSLRDSDGPSSRMSSRRTSFGSQCSMGTIAISGANRFAAFEFFTTTEVESILNDASEPGESTAPAHNWLKRGFEQFVLECVPVQKLQGLYRPYEHHWSDVFSRLSFCVSDVNAIVVNLSQHMVSVQPAGQFLDMSYAASFLDPHNFRGRLLQHMSEYKMATRKSMGDSKASSSNTPEAASKALSPRKQKRPDFEHSECPATPSEEGGDMQRSSLYSSFSSTHSGALSVAQAEREGCLPAPTPEELSAVEAKELSTPEVTIRFGTLPLDVLPVLHHIELRVADAERTLTFYDEVLGMTLIDKKTAQGFGFTLYFLAFHPPTHTSYHYWLWLQRFSCICIKAVTDGMKVTRYHDLEPAECGFLGFSFLCSEANERQLLDRFESKNVNVDHVEDEVYGRKVMQIRDPQNVPIRIVLTT
ncbi:hypothetical protein Esti_005522 [Eimeria stiedai]